MPGGGRTPPLSTGRYVVLCKSRSLALPPLVLLVGSSPEVTEEEDRCEIKLIKFNK
jgi:hypothetical protein